MYALLLLAIGVCNSNFKKYKLKLIFFILFKEGFMLFLERIKDSC